MFFKKRVQRDEEGAKAQKDIKKNARGDNRVDSMEEWFQYNFPNSDCGLRNAEFKAKQQ